MSITVMDTGGQVKERTANFCWMHSSLLVSLNATIPEVNGKVGILNHAKLQ
jgi:hypothetical protein